MKLGKLNNFNRKVNVNIAGYRVDWENLRHVSKPQTKVLNFLKRHWRSHILATEFLIPGSLLRIDFINFTRNVAIEVSPEATHRVYNPHFHRNNPFNFLKTIKRDSDKQQWCEENGFKFVEIYDEDLEILSPKWFEEKYQIIL